jgi:hypothetical protein
VPWHGRLSYGQVLYQTDPFYIGYSRGYPFQPLDVLIAVYTMLNVADEKSIYKISPSLTRGNA